MKFKSRKSIIFQLVTIFFCGISSFVIFQTFSRGIENYEFVLSEVILSLSTLYMVWIYFGTEYKLTKTQLIYKSGILKGKILIQDIKKIETNKNVWYGARPATAIKGLLLKYNKYDDIFISPKNEDKFISTLMELNNKIKMIEN